VYVCVYARATCVCMTVLPGEIVSQPNAHVASLRHRGGERDRESVCVCVRVCACVILVLWYLARSCLNRTHTLPVFAEMKSLRGWPVIEKNIKKTRERERSFKTSGGNSVAQRIVCVLL